MTITMIYNTISVFFFNYQRGSWVSKAPNRTLEHDKNV